MRCDAMLDGTVEDKSKESDNDEQSESVTLEEATSHVEEARPSYSHTQVKKNDVISYKLAEKEETSQVLSRAGKSNGKYRFWWNVKNADTGENKSLNTEDLEDLRKVEEVNILETNAEEALVTNIPRNLHHLQECVDAKDRELKSWEDFEVYEEVADRGQKTLRTNWILVRKKDGVKARLCVRGDLEDQKDQIRTDSPTVNRINIKLFLLIAVHMKWKIRTADVKSAFLQGKKIDREVFLKPPKECRIPGIIWLMKKRAYGFVDASRGFYLELKKSLEDLGCIMSKNDPAMYLYYDEHNTLAGIILSHVDDLLYGSGEDIFEESVMTPLRSKFSFGHEDNTAFDYVGMQVTQVKGAVIISQEKYVDMLEVPDLEDVDMNDNPLNEEAQELFRSCVGKIGWISMLSRPDLSFDSVMLSTRLGKANMKDLKLAVKSLRKVKSETTEIKFQDLGSPEDWFVEGHGDAGFKSLLDGVSSCGGQVVLVGNKKTGVYSVVSWRSRKLKRVVSSSTDAEALAANDVLDEIVYIKEVLKELLGSKVTHVPLELFTDSKNLYRLVIGSSLADNPRLRTEVVKLQESLRCGELTKIHHVSGEHMIADCLTKRGASPVKLLNILRRNEKRQLE